MRGRGRRTSWSGRPALGVLTACLGVPEFQAGRGVVHRWFEYNYLWSPRRLWQVAWQSLGAPGAEMFGGIMALDVIDVNIKMIIIYTVNIDLLVGRCKWLFNKILRLHLGRPGLTILLAGQGPAQGIVGADRSQGLGDVPLQCPGLVCLKPLAEPVESASSGIAPLGRLASPKGPCGPGTPLAIFVGSPGPTEEEALFAVESGC